MFCRQTEPEYPTDKETHLMDINQECTDCEAELENGFILDISVATAFKASWHRGEPDDKTILDFLRYGPGIKHDHSKLLAIQALRCTKCGLLKLYANQ